MARALDRLRLNSARRFSHLPGRPFPLGTPMFPTRDQLIAHLERHSSEPGMELLCGANVTRIDRGEDGWLVRLDGGVVRARQLVVATGYDNVPHIPDWPGLTASRAACCTRPATGTPTVPGAEGVVAGPGSSGMRSRTTSPRRRGQVWLAARTAPNTSCAKARAACRGT